MKGWEQHFLPFLHEKLLLRFIGYQNSLRLIFCQSNNWIFDYLLHLYFTLTTTCFHRSLHSTFICRYWQAWVCWAGLGWWLWAALEPNMHPVLQSSHNNQQIKCLLFSPLYISGVRSWESNLKWVLLSVYFVENSSLMGLWGWWNVNVPSTKLKQAEKAKKLHWTRETYVISLQFWHYEQLVHIKKSHSIKRYHHID